jgi:hypothetical protein
MKNAYIKFLTDADRQKGLNELSEISQIIGLSDDIFCIPLKVLSTLDDLEINYTHASSEEVTGTNLRTWRFAHP